MRTAHVNGIDLEYEVTGEGEPVLLISPVLADGFVPIVAEPSLARYQMVRYHKRGWVGSGRTEGPVTIADHAVDAVALLDHLGIRRAHVVGHSSGAAVAVQMAIDSPDRVHTLALLELSLLTVPSGAGFLAAAQPVFDAYAAGDNETAIAGFLAAVSGMQWERCHQLLDDAVPGMVVQTVKDADTFFGVELPGLAQWDLSRADAAGINRPVLSVLGSRTEPLWHEVAAFLRESLPYVDEVVIDGVGHLLHLEQPAAVADALAGFLARNGFDREELARLRRS